MNDEKRQKTITALLAIVIVGVGIWAFASFVGGDQGAAVLLSEEDFGSLPVSEISDAKIVYTLDMSVDKSSLENDCRNRGGEFNECGRGCDGEECALVCAYTCEL